MFLNPNNFFSVLVNFIIKKLKSKHLVCLSFLWGQVFLREREKIFYTYSWSFSSVISCGACQSKIVTFDRLSSMNYRTSKDYQADQIYNFLLALHCIHDFFALLLHMDRYLVPAMLKVLKNIQKTVRVKTSLQTMSLKLFLNRIFRILKIPAVLSTSMSLPNNFKVLRIQKPRMYYCEDPARSCHHLNFPAYLS